MKTLRMAVMLVLLTFAAQAVFAQSDSNCKIKGFLTKDGKKLYLAPGHKLYDKIQINTEGGEQWFCTAEEAERAGFLFVPDPNAPQLRPAAAKQTAAPTATPEPQQQAEQTVAPAEQPTPEPQPTEQAVAEQVTEQQPPVETPQEQQSESSAPWKDDSSSTRIGMDAAQLDQLKAKVMMFLIPVLLAVGVFLVIMVISRWLIFSKAGKPGWAALIPFYGAFVLLEIAGMPIWVFFLTLLPYINWVISVGTFLTGIFSAINLIIWFMTCLKLAQNFGKGAGYALGLFFLPFLFFPMLAFGSAEYNG